MREDAGRKLSCTWSRALHQQILEPTTKPRKGAGSLGCCAILSPLGAELGSTSPDEATKLQENTMHKTILAAAIIACAAST
ncbi:MAG: hypothetical protein WBM71_15770, partial [Sedimenticolaceae bacterium]